ncbi:MAG: Ppx/GppA family phosphatase [Pedosphaera sp.]|nr:Ppx/GppA family phosphatase [Pedosphaera sp.]
MPRKRRRAVIDIGTNSVKLLVAEVNGHVVRPLCEDSKQTRLGRGFYSTRKLQREPIAKTAAAVAQFARTAREWKARSIHVFATSAARDAKNSRALLKAVKRASGLEVEIISGEQEADWVFQGVTTDARLKRHPLLLLDVGGGSTEFILGHGDHKHFRHSFPLGTVRLLEKFPVSDPPKPAELAALRKWLRDFLRTHVHPRLGPELRSERKLDPQHGVVQLVGTGGTTSILARMEAKMEGFDRQRIERKRLTLARVRAHVKKLWRLPLAARQKIVGLPRKRADVILPGALIYETVMAELGFKQLRVSTRGLRFAAVMAGD